MKVAERTDVSTRRPQRVRRGHRPGVVWPLLVLLGVLSMGGFIGGVSFVSDPTGADLGSEAVLAAEDAGGRLLPAWAVPARRVWDRIPGAHGGIGLALVSWTGSPPGRHDRATTGRGSERSGRALRS
jgi:hypothetical protein